MPIKIVIAPQNFKGSLTAYDAAIAIEKGILEICPEAKTVLVPIADGGDGTLEALVNGTKGKIFSNTVTNPLGAEIVAEWGVMGDQSTAVIEMAKASGLALINYLQRDPLSANTNGTGQLIKNALDKKYSKIIIGLGGSATNDGGIGMARHLGFKFIDKNGKEISGGGGKLIDINSIDIADVDKRIEKTHFIGASDVTNILCGDIGAAAIFGPQKGASEQDIRVLDQGLHNLAQVIFRDLGVSVKELTSGGAAGGLGAGIVAFLGGELTSGIDLISDVLNLEENIKDADLIITGEGQTDRSSIFDKGPVGIARMASEYSVPTVILTGSLGRGYRQVYAHNIAAVIPIADKPMRFEVSLLRTKQLLQSTAERVMRLLLIGQKFE